MKSVEHAGTGKLFGFSSGPAIPWEKPAPRRRRKPLPAGGASAPHWCVRLWRRIRWFFGRLRCPESQNRSENGAQSSAVLDSKILNGFFNWIFQEWPDHDIPWFWVRIQVVWPWLPVTLNWCSHDTGDCWHWHLSSCIVRAVSGLTVGRLVESPGSFLRHNCCGLHTIQGFTVLGR